MAKKPKASKVNHNAIAATTMLDNIRRAEKEVAAKEKLVTEIRADLKDAREGYDGAVAHLRTLIRDIKLPLLAGPEDKAGAEDAEPAEARPQGAPQ